MRRLIYRVASLACALCAGWFVVVGVREIRAPNIYEQLVGAGFFVLAFTVAAILAWRRS